MDFSDDEGIIRYLSGLRKQYGGLTRDTPIKSKGGLPTKLGSYSHPEPAANAVYHAVQTKNKVKLKKAVRQALKADFHNDYGQSPLYLACVDGTENIVEILLENGANPNERSIDGSTPLHVASFTGNLDIIQQLVLKGGDLRLHDYNSRNAQGWAEMQENQRKKQGTLNFLAELKSDLKSEFKNIEIDMKSKNESPRLSQPQSQTQSHTQIPIAVQDASQTQSSSPQPEHKTSKKKRAKKFLKKAKDLPHKGQIKKKKAMANKIKKIAKNRGKEAAVTVVQEGDLQHDFEGHTYNNGPFMVMECMKWKRTCVTVKRLHKAPVEGGIIDMLIEEKEKVSKLRHPKILLLMAVCKIYFFEGLVLVYERVECGSLFDYLYNQAKAVDETTLCDMFYQIADALIFLHDHNYVHCNVTSHAVQLLSPGVAKLCNFEYMIENGGYNETSVAGNTQQDASYNWMAPEVMKKETVTEKTDVYSICSVLLETLMGMPPWHGLSADEIRTEVVQKKNMPAAEEIETYAPHFKAMLKSGLVNKQKKRVMTVQDFKDIMYGLLEELQYNKREFRSPSTVKEVSHFAILPTNGLDSKFPLLQPPPSPPPPPPRKKEDSEQDSKEDSEEDSEKDSTIAPQATSVPLVKKDKKKSKTSTKDKAKSVSETKKEDTEDDDDSSSSSRSSLTKEEKKQNTSGWLSFLPSCLLGNNENNNDVFSLENNFGDWADMEADFEEDFLNKNKEEKSDYVCNNEFNVDGQEHKKNSMEEIDHSDDGDSVYRNQYIVDGQEHGKNSLDEGHPSNQGDPFYTSVDLDIDYSSDSPATGLSHDRRKVAIEEYIQKQVTENLESKCHRVSFHMDNACDISLPIAHTDVEPVDVVWEPTNSYSFVDGTWHREDTCQLDVLDYNDNIYDADTVGEEEEEGVLYDDGVFEHTGNVYDDYDDNDMIYQHGLLGYTENICGDDEETYQHDPLDHNDNVNDGDDDLMGNDNKPMKHRASFYIEHIGDTQIESQQFRTENSFEGKDEESPLTISVCQENFECTTIQKELNVTEDVILKKVQSTVFTKPSCMETIQKTPIQKENNDQEESSAKTSLTIENMKNIQTLIETFDEELSWVMTVDENSPLPKSEYKETNENKQTVKQIYTKHSGARVVKNVSVCTKSSRIKNVDETETLSNSKECTIMKETNKSGFEESFGRKSSVFGDTLNETDLKLQMLGESVKPASHRTSFYVNNVGDIQQPTALVDVDWTTPKPVSRRSSLRGTSLIASNIDAKTHSHGKVSPRDRKDSWLIEAKGGLRKVIKTFQTKVTQHECRQKELMDVKEVCKQTRKARSEIVNGSRCKDKKPSVKGNVKDRYLKSPFFKSPFKKLEEAKQKEAPIRQRRSLKSAFFKNPFKKEENKSKKKEGSIENSTSQNAGKTQLIAARDTKLINKPVKAKFRNATICLAGANSLRNSTKVSGADRSCVSLHGKSFSQMTEKNKLTDEFKTSASSGIKSAKNEVMSLQKCKIAQISQIPPSANMEGETIIISTNTTPANAVPVSNSFNESNSSTDRAECNELASEKKVVPQLNSVNIKSFSTEHDKNVVLNGRNLKPFISSSSNMTTSMALAETTQSKHVNSTDDLVISAYKGNLPPTTVISQSYVDGAFMKVPRMTKSTSTLDITCKDLCVIDAISSSTSETFTFHNTFSTKIDARKWSFSGSLDNLNCKSETEMAKAELFFPKTVFIGSQQTEQQKSVDIKCIGSKEAESHFRATKIVSQSSHGVSSPEWPKLENVKDDDLNQFVEDIIAKCVNRVQKEKPEKTAVTNALALNTQSTNIPPRHGGGDVAELKVVEKCTMFHYHEATVGLESGKERLNENNSSINLKEKVTVGLESGKERYNENNSSVNTNEKVTVSLQSEKVRFNENNSSGDTTGNNTAVTSDGETVASERDSSSQASEISSGDDFYCDDEIYPDMTEEHMVLQSTLLYDIETQTPEKKTILWSSGSDIEAEVHAGINTSDEFGNLSPLQDNPMLYQAVSKDNMRIAIDDLSSSATTSQSSSYRSCRQEQTPRTP